MPPGANGCSLALTMARPWSQTRGAGKPSECRANFPATDPGSNGSSVGEPGAQCSVRGLTNEQAFPKVRTDVRKDRSWNAEESSAFHTPLSPNGPAGPFGTAPEDGSLDGAGRRSDDPGGPRDRRCDGAGSGGTAGTDPLEYRQPSLSTIRSAGHDRRHRVREPPPGCRHHAWRATAAAFSLIIPRSLRAT